MVWISESIFEQLEIISHQISNNLFSNIWLLTIWEFSIEIKIFDDTIHQCVSIVCQLAHIKIWIISYGMTAFNVKSWGAFNTIY